jgi:serine/threonine-protein kinase HipA
MRSNYDVFIHTEALAMKAGELVVSRGAAVFAAPSFQFTYSSEYLAAPAAFALSPDMPLLRDIFYSRSVDRDMLGAFADAMPDRWGRRLVERRLGQAGLADIDYLLNVPDFSRQGALRISPDNGETFLGKDFINGSEDGLQKIHHAIERFVNNESSDAEIEQMILTGSQSNGGQFPKTVLVDGDGDLCIAKFQGEEQRAFPHWEVVCLELARDAGIEVPSFRHLWLGDISVLIEKRFDRTHSGFRVPYSSAESFMRLPTNPTFITPYSVFATNLHRQTGPEESRKLFARAAFLLLVNSVDDHWRNHGLLWQDGAWRLAPLFDVNPTTMNDPYDLPQLSGKSEVKRSIATLVDTAKAFGLSPNEGKRRVLEIAEVVRNWKPYAERYLRSEREIAERAEAFSTQDRFLRELS